jgi:hypothetical protein
LIRSKPQYHVRCVKWGRDARAYRGHHRRGDGTRGEGCQAPHRGGRGLTGVRVREADRGPLWLWFIGTCRAEALPREDGPALPCGEGAAIQNQSHPLQAIRRAEKRLGFGDLLGDRRGVYDVLLELRATTRGSWVSP